MKRLLVLILLGVGLAAAAILWQSNGPDSGGPPAGRNGSPAAGEQSGRVIAEGRVVAYPGAHIIVSAEMGGIIEQMPVGEKSTVKKGDLLAELRANDLKASLEESRARLAEVSAELDLAKLEENRLQQLRDTGACSAQELDRARSQSAVLAARRLTAHAAVNRLEATLAKARIVAPIDGVVLARHVHPGENLEPSARVLTLADLSRIRVEAEVDEFDIGRVKLGSLVKIFAEAFPGECWRGRIEEIPDAVVERNLRPQDPARPSDVRVLMVKIALAEPTPLKLGQRVEVEISQQRAAQSDPLPGKQPDAMEDGSPRPAAPVP